MSVGSEYGDPEKMADLQVLMELAEEAKVNSATMVAADEMRKEIIEAINVQMDRLSPTMDNENRSVVQNIAVLRLSCRLNRRITTAILGYTNVLEEILTSVGKQIDNVEDQL